MCQQERTAILAYPRGLAILMYAQKQPSGKNPAVRLPFSVSSLPRSIPVLFIACRGVNLLGKVDGGPYAS